jgi:hypothetical protein
MNEGAKYEVNVDGRIHPWSKGTISVPEIRQLGGFSADAPVVAVDLVTNTEKSLSEDAVHDVAAIEEGKPLVKKTCFKQATD